MEPIQVDDIVMSSHSSFKKMKFRVLDVLGDLIHVVKMKDKENLSDEVQKFNFDFRELYVIKKNKGRIRYLKVVDSLSELLFTTRNQPIKPIVAKEQRPVSARTMRRKSENHNSHFTIHESALSVL